MFSDDEKAMIFHALSALLRCELYKVPPVDETEAMREALLSRSQELQEHAISLDDLVKDAEEPRH